MNPNINPEGLPNPFRHFCMSIGAIPTSYKNSLDYYETLLWLIKYLENAVIPAVDNNAQALEELQGLFVQLKNYVDDYFNNLDIQNEINTKLDNMASDGTLTHLIKDYVDPIYQVYENSINNTVSNQNSRITTVEHELSSLASGSPKGTYPTVADLKTANPDTGVYIVTGNGHIYSWTKNQSGDPIDLGVYQATGFSKLIETKSITLGIQGFIKSADGLLNTSAGFFSSDFIEVNSNQYVEGNLGQVRDVIALVAFYDKDKKYISSYWGEDATATSLLSVNKKIPDNCKYIRVSTKDETGYNASVKLNVVDFINKVNNDVEQIENIDLDITGYIRPDGTLSETNGFKSSDFIDVKFGQTIAGKLEQASSNLSLVAFYDKDKKLLMSYTGDGTAGSKLIDINFDIPYGTKYIRVSTKLPTHLEYYANVVTNSKNWLKGINETIEILTSLNFTVDKNLLSTDETHYNSLIDCLKYIQNLNTTKPINVYVKAGNYDIYEELGGEDFLATITPSDTAYTIDQPWLFNVNLIGLGNVILKYNPPVEVATRYPLGEGLIAPLNVRGNVNIENINIECSYCRYAIHDETAGISTYNNTYHNYKNVNAKIGDKLSTSSGGHTIGLGFDNGQSYNFENCKLINNNNNTTTNAPLFIHNRESYGGNFNIINCIFETVGNNALLLSNVGNQERTNVNISNSHFNKQIFLRSENNQDVENCFQIYMNNCNNINVGESSHVISNPYTPIIKNTI